MLAILKKRKCQKSRITDGLSQTKRLCNVIFSNGLFVVYSLKKEIIIWYLGVKKYSPYKIYCLRNIANVPSFYGEFCDWNVQFDKGYEISVFSYIGISICNCAWWLS